MTIAVIKFFEIVNIQNMDDFPRTKFSRELIVFDDEV